MVHNYQIIKSILSEPWFLSSEEASKLGYLLSGVFSSNRFSFEPVTKENLAQLSFTTQVGGGDSSQVDTIGVVDLCGMLYKYDTMCAYGMETYGRLIRDFSSRSDISAIVLRFDTPGGMVSGTEELGNEIATCPKPIIAFISDQACSAGYWLASNCKKIIANNTTASIGSIGVMCTYTDLTAYYAKEGIKMHEIYAPQSTEKNKESREIREGNYDTTRESLKVLAEKFQNIVKNNRPGATEDQLTGKVYFAQDVVGSLIDEIGSFDRALTIAAEMGREFKTNKLQKNKTMLTKPFSALASVAGVEAFESIDDAITLTADQAVAVESRLESITNAELQLTTAQSAFSSLQSQNNTLVAENKSLKDRLAKFDNTPGAESAGVSVETDAHSDDDFAPAKTFGSAVARAREFSKTL